MEQVNVESCMAKLEIDEIDNVELDSMLKRVQEKSILRMGKSSPRDWLALKTYDPTEKDNFSRRFIDCVKSEGDLFVPAKSLTVGQIYERVYEYDRSYKYAERQVVIFVVREKSESHVTVEFFQTPLKAYKQLAVEAKNGTN